jgi:hypothetical protein
MTRTILACLAAGCLALVGSIVLTRGPARGQTLPGGYTHFTSAVRMWVDGDDMVIQTSAVPDHKSPYFPTSDPRYEAYNGANPNWQQNPNEIETQTIEYRIPLDPQEATTHASTPLGPMGVAVNGVPLFNQYAAGGQPLTNEINSFDQYDGHPQMTGVYHYHAEPYALTAANGKDSLIGYLLDGFPVYGPEEDGRTLTDADLDEYHGHFGPTADYPDGIYHYHITAEAPYINGAGFYGTAGTVTYTFSATPTPAATNTASATPTATQAPSVGGVASIPGLRTPAGAAPASHRTRTYLAMLLGAVSVGSLLAAGLLLRKRRQDAKTS